MPNRNQDQRQSSYRGHGNDPQNQPNHSKDRNSSVYANRSLVCHNMLEAQAYHESRRWDSAWPVFAYSAGRTVGGEYEEKSILRAVVPNFRHVKLWVEKFIKNEPGFFKGKPEIFEVPTDPANDRRYLKKLYVVSDLPPQEVSAVIGNWLGGYQVFLTCLIITEWTPEEYAQRLKGVVIQMRPY